MLNVEPEADTNPVGGTHTLTATLVPAGGNVNNPPAGTCAGATGPVNVDFEVICTAPGVAGDCTPDPQYQAQSGGGGGAFDEADTPGSPDLTCTIPQGQTSCTVSYTRNNEGTDQINGFVDEGGNNNPADDDPNAADTVVKTWQARAATDLDCQPDDDTNPATDDPATPGVQNQHTVTCQVTDQFGQTFGGGEIDGEFLAGPNDPDAGNNPPVDINDCGGNTGTCTYTYTNTGNGPGTDTICFFLDDDGDDTNLEECASPEAFNADDPSTNAEDTVRKTWAARNGASLDCEPDDATNAPGDTAHQITCTARDQFGALLAGQEIDGERLAGSANDADGTAAPPDLVGTTNGQGVATFNVTDVRPANTFGDRVDTFCFWIDDDGDSNNLEECASPEALVDANEADDEEDVVRKTYQGGQAPNTNPASQVNAEPETATNPVNTSHTINVSARDANNNETQQTPILADITSGPSANQQTAQAEITCANDTTGPPAGVNFLAGETQTHECTYTHAQFANDIGGAGTDQIRVFADTNNNGRFDAGEPNDEVTKTWAGGAFSLTLTPESDSATAGTCNEFTARVLDINGNPVPGVNVDVEQVLANAGVEPGEDRELAFCTPTNPTGPNPTTSQTGGNADPAGGGAGTQFGGVQGNNGGQTVGQAGRNTTVEAEVGPTNQNGEVTFGITINQTTQNATVNVRAWVDTANNNNNNDTFDAGEPTDTSTKTWTPGGQGAVTGLNAEPESATNPNGTQHQVTVTLTGAGGPVAGVTPNSMFAANASGRPAGDVADPNAGASPNATVANQGNFTVYNCTVSNAQGVSTCTFQDQPGTPPGTDTVIFFVNQAGGGTGGPDANEPQDAVQKTWTAGPQNLILDVTCAGSGTNDDQDVGETGLAEDVNPANAAANGTPDCTNPTSDPDEVFTASVTNANGIGQNNVRVDFSFTPNRVNGNAGTGNNSTNDATLAGGAGGGGQVGTSPAGLVTFCITGATGTCSVTLTNATPQAGDRITVNGTISGGTGGTPSDDATKEWQTGRVNQGGTITLTPRAATNQVGTQHTVTATVRNQFGQPVQGANVDFTITSGPNVGLVQAGMTDAVTDANGVATFTYTSNVTGTDTIQACTETGGSENDQCNAGEPVATATKTWQTGPVTTGSVSLDMVARVQSNAGADTVVDDCEANTPANTNREKSATNQINPNQGAGAGAESNFHEICAAAFQTNAQAPTAGAQITFTISGPGRISAVSNATGRCSTAAVPAAGTTLTVTADSNGIARACLFSQQVGRTTVTATSGTPAQSDTGTKDWTVSPATARFIQLCHGDVAGTTCETAQQTNEPGDDHQLTARVTDRQGNPVANVPVQFRETGPAIFTPQGGSTATVNTDANGLASVLMTSDVEGTSTVVAEIFSGGVGGARGPQTNDDECEAPAGTNNQPAAGNCISQTLTKVWDETPVVDPECDDGEDNDNDGLVDLDDPGCVDDNDNSELPVNGRPERTQHDRRISIRFNDGTGKNNNGLVVFGRLRVPDGYNNCRSQQPINIQRRINGRWVTKKSTDTNRRGRYAVEIFDQASRYRAVAVRTKIEDLDANTVDICLKTVKQKRHRHRR